MNRTSGTLSIETESPREAACRLNRALPKLGLVTMHSGNASVLDAIRGRVFIKPSGFDYDILTPVAIVEVDLFSGLAIGNPLKPSVDLPHHLYLYRHMPEVRAIVHTHSNHATAFAACHRPIPLCLTAIADEFGGSIPCAPFASNDGDAIGRGILEHRTAGPAILLANHGVFAWGPTADAALKAAVMVEDVAKTVLLARQLGDIHELDADEAAKWFDRYRHRYGQNRAA